MFNSFQHKITSIGFILLFLASSLVAQKQAFNNHLLWEISGPGISKASYLYITIPSSDKRIFNFSDSVYWAFEQCKSIAIEIAPDSMRTALFERYFQETGPNEALLKIMPEGAYQYFSQRLYKSTGYTLDQTSISNPAILHSLVSRKINIGRLDYSIKLLDYFIRFAELRNKEVLSLENLKERVELNLYTDFETDEILNLGINSADIYKLYTDSSFGEQLIQFYLDGDIMGYLKKINAGGNVAEREQATHNHIMLERLSALLPKQSLFIVLPIQVAGGQAGLLELLRNNGYQIRPMSAIYSDKTAANYRKDFAPDKLPWPMHRSKKFGYQARFPAVPDKDLPKGFMVESYYCSDAASKTNYYTAVLQSPLDDVAEDTLLERILQRSDRIPEASKLTSKKAVFSLFEGDSIRGIDIIYPVSKTLHSRLQVYVREQRYIYFFVIESRKLEQLTNVAANKFFESITFTPLPTFEKALWRDFTWKESACQFQVLETPNFSVEQEEPSNKQSTRDLRYTFNNPEDGSSFIIQCTELANGYLYSDSAAIFSEWQFNLAQNPSMRLIRQKDISDSNFIAREYVVEDPINNGIYRLYYRGNKLYYLMVHHRKMNYDSLGIENFFNSFKLLPFDSSELVRYNATDRSYSIMVPKKTSPRLIGKQKFYLGLP